MPPVPTGPPDPPAPPGGTDLTTGADCTAEIAASLQALTTADDRPLEAVGLTLIEDPPAGEFLLHLYTAEAEGRRLLIERPSPWEAFQTPSRRFLAALIRRGELESWRRARAARGNHWVVQHCRTAARSSNRRHLQQTRIAADLA